MRDDPHTNNLARHSGHNRYKGSMTMCQPMFAIARQLTLREMLASLSEREEGQDMIEYALLAALISVVAVALIILVGPYLDNMFSDVANALGLT